jgi:hypothetical protein
MTKPEAIERFHLALLGVMPTYLPAASYVVKGGANLRLFLGSVRRSSDIDLDFVGNDAWDLPRRMGLVMESAALRDALGRWGLRASPANLAKSTPTTARWKLTIEGPGVRAATKVEFSMRQGAVRRYRSESVSSAVALAAGVRPAANHYTPESAVAQKVVALADRRETQARDVFDLDFLFARYPADASAARPDPAKADLARQRVFELTYAAYHDLVVDYLEPDSVAMYDGEDEWGRMVLEVGARLDEMAVR